MKWLFNEDILIIKERRNCCIDCKSILINKNCMIKVRIEYCVLWLILIVLFIYNDIFLEIK